MRAQLYLAQFADDFKPVHAGKHDVQDQHVEVAGFGEAQPFRAVVGQRDRITLTLQRAANVPGEAALILDDQDPHDRNRKRPS